LSQIPLLATVNASLNAIAAVFLGAGFYFIRRRQIAAHRVCMIIAFGVSVVFLICYLTYHYQVGDVRFQGHGPIRPVYFTILISHIILAVTTVPLAIMTLSRALHSRFDAHRRIARWTWPIWMYVSVTGVIVYVMVYHIYGPPIIR
jgi:putative membrane protein